MRILGFFILFNAIAGLAGASEYNPPIAPASKDGHNRIQAFKVDPGLQIELIAAEPMLANPVAFYIDNGGKIYVAETFRHHKGVTDMRSHRSWLVDDLACETIEDRLIAMKKNLGTRFPSYTMEHDRVRLLEDSDGDGVMDRASVFADGFKDALAGIGSGLLEHRGDVYYTCIPDLWILRDPDGNGVAEERELLHSGYGVHISLLGHDSHGLRKGPDGRIYFSIGDRGFNIPTEDGRLEHPHTGAVLRCEPDGSNLEVVHLGLRNPQELAFDDYGNLFTGDNNSDAGDQARWVYIVEGGESGWLINHQWSSYPVPRGVWQSEKIWFLEEEGRPACYLPPLAHIGSGPSGLAYCDGTGLPEKYKDVFFLCDFRGTPTQSKIHAIRLKPKGASFELDERWDFVSGNLPTDVDFGVRNGIYFSDWVDGWDQPLKGRIYRVFDPQRDQDPIVLETEKILGDGFAHRSMEDLLALLAHPNQRVRFEAQWALADLRDEAVPSLIDTASNPGDLRARLHALWALGQIGRTGAIDPSPLISLLKDSEVEIRSQAARVLGWMKSAEAVDPLIAALRDDSLRVRFLAASSLGSIGDPKAVGPVVDLLEANSDRDLYLRHGGVMGLLGCASEDQLVELKASKSPSVRLGALLALRKMKSPRVAEFLADPEFQIVAEAARAINDMPIPEAYPALAAALDRLPEPGSLYYEPLVRRAVNANFRLGEDVHANALVRFALSNGDPQCRAESLMRLAEWGDPDDQDKIDGVWRPLPDREAGIAAKAVEDETPRFLADPESKVRTEAIHLAVAHRFAGHDEVLLSILAEEEGALEPRLAALEALVSLHSPKAETAIEKARASAEPKLRSEAIAQLGRLDPGQAVGLFARILEEGSIPEKQSVFSSLQRIESKEADDLLRVWIEKFLEGAVPPEVHLDLLEAADAKDSAELAPLLERYYEGLSSDDPIRWHRPALFGGSAERGRKIFFENASVSCTRCHLLNGVGGGEVGPDLSDVGARLDRETILESIVAPNVRISLGFENVTLRLNDGVRLAGRVLEEDEETLTLEITSEGDAAGFEEDWDEDAFLESLESEEEAIPHSIVDVVAEGETPPALETRVVSKADITERRRNLSAMPDNMAQLLTGNEIRDLVEFLTSLK